MSCSGSLADLVADFLGGSGCGCGGLGGYAKSKVATIQVDATALAPFELPLEGIAEVALLAFRPTGGSSFLLHLDSTNAGPAQKLPASGLVIIQNQNADDFFTAIDISGTGEIEYLIAGS